MMNSIKQTLRNQIRLYYTRQRLRWQVMIGGTGYTNTLLLCGRFYENWHNLHLLEVFRRQCLPITENILMECKIGLSILQTISESIDDCQYMLTEEINGIKRFKAKFLIKFFSLLTIKQRSIVIITDMHGTFSKPFLTIQVIQCRRVIISHSTPILTGFQFFLTIPFNWYTAELDVYHIFPFEQYILIDEKEIQKILTNLLGLDIFIYGSKESFLL